MPEDSDSVLKSPSLSHILMFPSLAAWLVGIYLLVSGFIGQLMLPSKGEFTQISLENNVEKSALIIIGFLFSTTFGVKIYSDHSRDEEIKSLKRDIDSKKGDIKKLEVKLSMKDEDISEKTKQLDDWSIILNKVNETARERNDYEVLSIINNLGQKLRDNSDDFKILANVADWIEPKIDSWINRLCQHQFSTYGVSDNDIELLRMEIREHLSKLCYGLRFGVSEPKGLWKKIPKEFSSNNALYKKAFKLIEEQAVMEVEQSIEMGRNDQDCLKFCMQSLVHNFKG